MDYLPPVGQQRSRDILSVMSGALLGARFAFAAARKRAMSAGPADGGVAAYPVIKTPMLPPGTFTGKVAFVTVRRGMQRL